MPRSAAAIIMLIATWPRSNCSISRARSSPMVGATSAIVATDRATCRACSQTSASAPSRRRSVTRTKSHGCQLRDDGARLPASRIRSRRCSTIGSSSNSRTSRRDLIASQVSTPRLLPVTLRCETRSGPGEPRSPVTLHAASAKRRRPDGIRPVSRATRRATRGDADLCPPLRLIDGGGRGNRLVRAAPRRRDRSRSDGDHARRTRRGVQALQHGPRVPAPKNTSLARNRTRRPLSAWRHRRTRRGSRGRREQRRRVERRRRSCRLPCHRQPQGARPMNHLLRSNAPITDSNWQLIDDEARSRLTAALAARKVVDLSGPFGWEHSASNLGSTTVLAAGPVEGVTARQRKVLPLVELRAEFTIDLADLRDHDRGRPDVDLQELDDAAHRIAIAENVAVFHGWPEAGITGITEASPHPSQALGVEPESFPRAVAAAVDLLLQAGIGGPYALALGREQHTHVVETAEHGGYPLLDHLRKILDGPVLWAPGVKGAVIAGLRGGDFRFEFGQDLAIGYDHHDTERVHLYIEESFSFVVATPEAAIALSG